MVQLFSYTSEPVVAQVDTRQFILQGCRNNPWVQLPGWHVDCIYEDWLHVVDLALVPDAAASVPGL